jgi:2-polyprenyl-6-methoxyphenol hydroxylase-like FAD-dependent oxidoreductase
MSSNQPSVASQQALVIGSGMAGLLSARVLADYFEHVTVIDRDRLPDSPEFRAGVPQGRHVHGFLLRGLQLLEQYFPGISGELEASGAEPLDWINDLEFHTVGGIWPRFSSPYKGLACSRPLLEWTTRQRLAAHPRVSILELREAIELLPNAEKTGVGGLRIRERQPEEHTLGKEEELSADLIVDASGRDSPVLKWLSALGYEQPEVVRIDGKLGYATRHFRRPSASTFPRDWRVLALLNSYPEIVRGGIIFPVEGDRWIVTVAGSGEDHPPTDEAGFMAFIEGMKTPRLAEAIRQAEPVSPIYGYQRMENQWRHFERLTRWPESFVVVGDAVCHLNPYYGQGMAVSAQIAFELGQALQQGNRPGLAQRYQKAVAKVFASPWVLATSEDMRSPLTEGGGQPGFSSRLMYGYVDRLKQLIAADPSALRTFVGVSHLLKPSTALFQPGMIVGALRVTSRREIQ